MSYIILNTNYKLTLRQENLIKEKIGGLIKTKQSLMLHIKDDQIIYLNGNETKCMMIQIFLFEKSNVDIKKKLKKGLIQMISQITGIESDNIYVTVDECKSE